MDFVTNKKNSAKIGNQLNRNKNQIPDFSDFYFSSYGHFCAVIIPILDEISRKKSASSIKTGSKLGGGSARRSLENNP